jgi:hypothetical protein
MMTTAQTKIGRATRPGTARERASRRPCEHGRLQGCPAARPRVALGKEQTGGLSRIYPKKPFGPCRRSPRSPRSPGSLKREARLTACERICNDSAILGSLVGSRDTRGPYGLSDAYPQDALAGRAPLTARGSGAVGRPMTARKDGSQEPMVASGGWGRVGHRDGLNVLQGAFSER